MATVMVLEVVTIMVGGMMEIPNLVEEVVGKIRIPAAETMEAGAGNDGDSEGRGMYTN